MPGTPAPHTPIQFLQGGAGAMFSAACVAALVNAGYDPNDFGSYDYVDDRISKARDRVNLHNDHRYGVPSTLPPKQRDARQAALDKWRAANPPPARPPAPSPHDRTLAGCQSGHLVMNSSYQRERENPCTSVVDGFEDNLAPCMPHEGRTSVAGTEHHWVYHNEIAQPRARGLTPEPQFPAGCTDPGTGQAPPVPPHRYDAAAIDADEEARIRNNPRLNSEGAATPMSGSPVGSGSGAAPAAPAAAGAAASASAPTASASSSTPLWQQEITGNTAADCVNNFRKAAMSAMKDHCEQSTAANEAEACGNDPSRTPEQYQAQLQAQIAAANAAGNTKQAGQLGRQLNRAVEANCRAAMGRRLQGGNPHTDARCPAGSPATTHAKSHGAETPTNLFGSEHY